MSEDFTPNKLVDSAENLEAALRSWRKYIHAETILIEKKKTFLAALKLKKKKEIGEMSDAALETEAKGSEEWAVFVEQWKKDLVEAGVRQVKVEEARIRWETDRSLGAAWRSIG